MYPQARFFIKTALVNLCAAFLLGAILLINQALNLDARINAWHYAFYHLVAVGWITQLIGGVALWMFPPLSRERPRGDERVAWFAYGALNVGLWLRVIAEPLNQIAPAAIFGALLIMSAILQTLAAWCIVVALWRRVKGASPPRTVPFTKTDKPAP